MSKPSDIAIAAATALAQAQRPTSQSDVFNAVAKKANKRTIMQAMPGGEFMIWMTKGELDPVRALLSAAMSIIIRRGDSQADGKGITIRRVEGVIAAGANLFWKVTDKEGNEIASGYAKDEDDAAAQMAPHLAAGIL